MFSIEPFVFSVQDTNEEGGGGSVREQLQIHQVWSDEAQRQMAMYHEDQD